MTGLYQYFVRRKAWRQVKRDGLWFVDIPRTGSSSIRTELAAHYGNHFGKADLLQPQYNVPSQAIPSHLTAREVIEILGLEVWNKLFTFSMVRNPWARLRSMYNYRVHQAQVAVTFSFKQYVELFFSSGQHPYSPYDYHGHYYQCVDYLLDHQGQLLVDEIFRFEEREKLKDMNIRRPDLKLGNLKLNSIDDEGSYQDHYDQESRELVAQWARRDIEYFGYKFD